MKKLIALFLALIMLLGTTFALAEDVDVEGNWSQVDLYDDAGNWVGYNQYEDGVLTFHYDYPNNTGYQYSDGEELYHYVITRNEEQNYNIWDIYSPDNELQYINVWSGDEENHFDLSFAPDGSMYEDSVWGNGIGDVYYDKESGSWFDADGNAIDAPDLSGYVAMATGHFPSSGKAAHVDPIWYKNNTAGVVGISLRDEYPSLTSKWYNVLPVDLSQDGTQTFPLVASNIYTIGSVTVTVAGDEVTTTYSYPSRVDYALSGIDETLAWFTTIEDITSDFLENPTSDLAFGTAISKENDLNGQDYALLFICNHVNYRIPLSSTGASLSRYWPNHPRMASYYANVAALREKVEENHAERQAATPTDAD